ncbi:MAG: Cys-Gln thioester bond-forming surface protein, partial [Clostridia bacterium]|nr:Cys-Gln thioester bond-forming surface protein [Clostridia bacterium]
FVTAIPTDSNGQASVENILPGKYELRETKAPAGYYLPSETIKFEITSEGEVILEDCCFASIKDGESTFITTSKGELEDGMKAPETNVDVIPGENTDRENVSTEGIIKYGNSYVKISFPTRNVSVSASDIEVFVEQIKTVGNTAVQSALKFDRKSSADQKAQQKIRDLYTDNNHFTDHSTITVTGAPEGHPFKYIGYGDYSGHYVSHIRVVYERDEAGNAVKDENGNYVIKELQHSGGTPLTYKGEPTTDINGPFDYATGTRSQQFLLKNENGDTVYGYCIDIDTGAQSGTWYSVANLEDNDYYASEEAEEHIRAIVTNGYWGTESGFGSLASLKTALKAALAAGKVDATHNIEFMNRVKYKDGMEITEGQYRAGSYVVWYLPEETVTLTDEIIDGLTEGEALDAMQAAIWSYANGSNHTLDGTDRMIVGDMYYASSAAGDSRNGVNDFEGAARTKALYQYLTTLEGTKATTTIINDKTFAENITLSVGSHIGNNVYNASIKFTIGDGITVNADKDNLTIIFTYVDANGETQTITKTITGENALTPDENGYYTIDGLTVKAGENIDFTINIAGDQYIDHNAYVFTAEGGIDKSQTMVGV